MGNGSSQERTIRTSKARKCFMGALALGAAAIVVLAPQVLLLFFCCILFAVFLTALCRWTEWLLPLSRKWSLTIVVLLLAGIVTMAGWLMGPQLSSQISLLSQQLPRPMSRFEEKIAATGTGQQVLRTIPDLQECPANAPGH